MPTLRQRLIATALRHYPFYSGAGSLANSRLLKTLSGASNEYAWCRTVGGEILAPLNDYVGRAAYFCGDLDPKVSWVCKQIVAPGHVVCDIGANIGLVTMLLSTLVGPGGHVYAFEPNPTPFDSLQSAISRNQRSNVTALQIALGAKSEVCNLSIPNLNSGAASLRTSSDLQTTRSIPVNVRTLDEVAIQYGIEKIQFMKIDVEGFESEVLQGCSHILKMSPPDAILFEMNDHPAENLINHPVFAILDLQGYAFLCLPKTFIQVKPLEFDPSRTRQLPGHDVLAIAKGATSKQIRAKLGVSC